MTGEVFGLSDQFEAAFLKTLAWDETRPFAEAAIKRVLTDTPVAFTLAPEAVEQVIDGGGITNARGIFNFAATTLKPDLITSWIAANKPANGNEVMEIASASPFTARWKTPSPA